MGRWGLMATRPARPGWVRVRLPAGQAPAACRGQDILGLTRPFPGTREPPFSSPRSIENAHG